ncbi:MAG TPA: DUF3180 domain-containing protein [Jatrophihabitans sp.]|nr:DUF3180 domain-containing protein [Jatrophihabitans sp.]
MNHRTRPSDLLVPFLIFGALSYLLLQALYGSLPPFQWFTAVPIAALALIEWVIASRVRGAVRHRPDARPMTALAVARAVALGKASALVGAALVGAELALVSYVWPDAGRTTAARHDLQVGLVLLAVTVLLLVAGLLVERAGIDPGHR